MSQSPSDLPPDWKELVAGDVMGDLDPSEQARLASIDSEDTRAETDDLAVTAAALQLAIAGSTGLAHELPDSLRQAITEQATEFFRSEDQRPAPGDPVVVTSQSQTVWRLTRREGLAWLAAAASVMFAAALWWSDRDSGTMSVQEARNELLATAKDVIRADWAPGTTPLQDPVGGDVVWSTARQNGYMRLVGLPVNDPAVEQYQLWIIDPERDDEPIDGGVFDVTSRGEAIIPIDAKLDVIQPSAFAITIEKPGGVVVSTQERLPLLAAI